MDYTKLIIRDLHVDMLIGIHEHEKKFEQPVLINIEAHIPFNSGWRNDSYEDTVCYDSIVKMIRALGVQGHINLVETYAEEIAHRILNDKRILKVLVRIEKTNVYDFAQGVGVEIMRSNFQA